MTSSNSERDLLAAVAATTIEDGFTLVCQVGRHSVVAAVVLSSRGALRVLDARSAELGDAEPSARMLSASGITPTPDRVAALDTERAHRAGRADLLLTRAQTHRQYLATPVYLAGAHGGSIDAATVLAALGPVAEVVADVIAALVARASPSTRLDLTLTGISALGPVVDSARIAVGGRLAQARVIEATEVETGITRIAAGAVRVVTEYPHTVGVLTHRIRDGLLTQVIESVPVVPVTQLVIECKQPQRIAQTMRIRVDGDGGWLAVNASAARQFPAGRYQLSVDPSRTEWGRLRVMADSGDSTEIPIEPERGIVA
ncbi:hypothetical protein ACFWVM_01420 [Nocardia fluminea]|uniref:hypothetical protein n=1 Tax=Nocardia fluminea TaxID=134984 RepID=UPI003660863D